jgi:ROS/MUCR transcriptional regulator protein
MRRQRPFATREEIEHYLGGDTIECLLCGRQFQSLGKHLRVQHNKTVSDYRIQFGLPWATGLTSTAKRAKSKWTLRKRAHARKRALKNPHLRLGPKAQRRSVPPFLKRQALEHLGINPADFGARFDARVRELFDKSLTDREIARVLQVGASTVNRRTKKWRKRKRSSRRGKR